MKNIIRKIIPAILTGAAAAILCFTCLTKYVDVQHTVDVPPKMVFMGDSIVTGYGLEGYSSSDNYSCQSYANILADRYTERLKDECGHEMLNVAVTGDTSYQLLEHLESGEFDDSLKGSEVVIISIGGNDILEIFLKFLKDDLGLSGDSSLSSDFDLFSVLNSVGSIDDDLNEALDNFEVNLGEIVTQIQSKTDGTIYLQTLYNPFEYYNTITFFVNFSDEKIDRLNQIITDNAVTDGNENYKVIDVAAEFDGKCAALTNIKSFDIHPNAAGHEAIADLIDSTLRQENYYYYTKVDRTSAILISVSACAAVIIIAAICAAAVKKIKKKKSPKHD